MNLPILRFACTQCGQCCNRSPEVELSEAAALADVFVFRLMFRLYSFPRTLSDYSNVDPARETSSQLFYERKRLLAEHAAHNYPVKMRHGGKATEHINYLMISALSLDTSPGACRALKANQCSIYDRRPFACRSVPIHYSRAEGSAEADLHGFVATPGYRCDTSEHAPPVIEGGRIVDRDMRRVRADVLALVAGDRPWRKAIVRRMKSASPQTSGLPSLRDVEASATFGATTTSMRVGWRIAAEAGIISTQDYERVIATQLVLIERELVGGVCPEAARKTLLEMRAEYLNRSSGARHALSR
jgi:Fe-S-cluster containining protein